MAQLQQKAVVELAGAAADDIRLVWKQTDAML